MSDEFWKGMRFTDIQHKWHPMGAALIDVELYVSRCGLTRSRGNLVKRKYDPKTGAGRHCRKCAWYPMTGDGD